MSAARSFRAIFLVRHLTYVLVYYSSERDGESFTAIVGELELYDNANNDL